MYTNIKIIVYSKILNVTNVGYICALVLFSSLALCYTQLDESQRSDGIHVLAALYPAPNRSFTIHTIVGLVYKPTGSEARVNRILNIYIYIYITNLLYSYRFASILSKLKEEKERGFERNEKSSDIYVLGIVEFYLALSFIYCIATVTKRMKG